LIVFPRRPSYSELDSSSRQNFKGSPHAAHLFNHSRRPLREQSALLGKEAPQSQERESDFFDGDSSRNSFYRLLQSQGATQGCSSLSVFLPFLSRIEREK